MGQAAEKKCGFGLSIVEADEVINYGVFSKRTQSIPPSFNFWNKFFPVTTILHVYAWSHYIWLIKELHAEFHPNLAIKCIVVFFMQ